MKGRRRPFATEEPGFAKGAVVIATILSETDPFADDRPGTFECLSMFALFEPKRRKRTCHITSHHHWRIFRQLSVKCLQFFQDR